MMLRQRERVGHRETHFESHQIRHRKGRVFGVFGTQVDFFSFSSCSCLVLPCVIMTLPATISEGNTQEGINKTQVAQRLFGIDLRPHLRTGVNCSRFVGSGGKNKSKALYLHINKLHCGKADYIESYTMLISPVSYISYSMKGKHPHDRKNNDNDKRCC